MLHQRKGVTTNMRKKIAQSFIELRYRKDLSVGQTVRGEQVFCGLFLFLDGVETCVGSS